jgi:hypothetical protein
MIVGEPIYGHEDLTAAWQCFELPVNECRLNSTRVQFTLALRANDEHQQGVNPNLWPAMDYSQTLE